MSGLVAHVPASSWAVFKDCSPLYEVPAKKGGGVVLKSGKIRDIWTVKKIASGADDGLSHSLTHGTRPRVLKCLSSALYILIYNYLPEGFNHFYGRIGER